MRSNRFGIALLLIQAPLTLALWWPVIERLFK